MMFNLYNKIGSIHQVALEINRLGVKSKRGYDFRQSMVSRILNNPIYTKATSEVYEYYKDKVTISSNINQFDGVHGLILYGKRNSQKEKLEYNQKENWQLAIGQHEGIVDGPVYVLAQRKRDVNAKLPSRLDTSLQSFLIGLVKCGKCGYRMMVGISGKGDKIYRYFRCHTKFDLGTCNQNSIRVDKLEDFVLDYLGKILSDQSSLESILSIKDFNDSKVSVENRKKKLEKSLNKVKNEMDKLLDLLLTEVIDQDQYKRKIISLKEDQSQIENQINEILVEQIELDLSESNIKYIIEMAKTKRINDQSTFEQKKDFARSFIKEIIVTDSNAEIVTFFNYKIFCS
jgi:site-specific DNA recombinase